MSTSEGRLTLVGGSTGEGLPVRVPQAIARASQYLFAKACENAQLRNWLDCHTSAFEFYGGLPEVVVPDNLARN